MIKKIDSVMLYSENADKLAEFYMEKAGFKKADEYEMEKNGTVYIFTFGDSNSSFGIMNHSKVFGKNKMPARFMINFEVDDIEKIVSQLKKNKVTQIADIYHIESYGLVATFEDIDGNYFQFVQVRPTK
jgi:predicted enzyme related to lactoylglutathione lyase